MFGFALGNADGIKFGIIESTYMDYLNVSFEIFINNKLAGLIYRI